MYNSHRNHNLATFHIHTSRQKLLQLIPPSELLHLQKRYSSPPPPPSAFFTSFFSHIQIPSGNIYEKLGKGDARGEEGGGEHDFG